MLRPADDLDAGDADRVELVAEDAAGLLDEGLAVGPALVDHLLDLAVAARVQGRERQVLELPLDRVDAEPVRERRVDLERLLGLLDLLRLGHVGQRAHVVEAVGELDDEHADVARHRHDELAVVLGLVLLLAVEVDLRQLGDAVHQRAHLGAEEALDVVEAGAGVLHRVVQQGRRHRGPVEAEPGADAGAPERVGDEGLARVAQLGAVPVLGEGVRAPHRVPVDVGVVRGDLPDELLELRLGRLERQPDVREVLGHAPRIPRPARRPRGAAPPRAARGDRPRPARPATGGLGICQLAESSPVNRHTRRGRATPSPHRPCFLGSRTGARGSCRFADCTAVLRRPTRHPRRRVVRSSCLRSIWPSAARPIDTHPGTAPARTRRGWGMSGAGPVGDDARRGPNALQGGSPGEAAPVPDLHGAGRRGAGAAAHAGRGVGVAVRGPPERHVPHATRGAGPRDEPDAGVGGRRVHDAGPAPGAGPPPRPAAGGAAPAQAGLVCVAGPPWGGRAALRRRRAAVDRDPGPAAPRGGRAGAASVAADDDALVHRRPLAARWGRRGPGRASARGAANARSRAPAAAPLSWRWAASPGRAAGPPRRRCTTGCRRRWRSCAGSP